MSMCRFASRDDEGYRQIMGEILILVSDKERKVQQALEEDRGIATMKTGNSSSTTSPSVAQCM
tara:strand:- start:933 stop:1121 length:189 start_codon:yes stop_codon:yes gene_type:complete